MNRRTVLKGLLASGLLGAGGRAQDGLEPANPAFHRLAARYSAQNRGISVLVMVDGRVVFEDYPNGGNPARTHELASGTKSFSGVMAAAARQDGLLDLDEPVAKTLPEWAADPRKSRITVRQLLSLTAGLEPDLPNAGGGRVPSYAQALQARALADPGTRFAYGPAAFQVFGEVMRRKLSGDPLAYLRRRVFDPIGLEHGPWRRDAGGNPHLPSGASLAAREWAKFGELVRLGGAWQGKPVLEPALLDECFKGTPVNPRYGLTWWLNRPVTPEQLRGIGRVSQATDLNPALLPDLVMAAGAGDQRLYVSRAQKLVAVRQAGGIVQNLAGQRSGYSDEVFLSLLLTGKQS